MSNKKTIIYLRDTLKICGPGKTIINTCRLLDREKYRLIVLATSVGTGKKNEFLNAVASTGVECFPISMRGFFDFSGLRDLLRLVKKFDAKLIQTHDAQTRRLGILVGLLSGVSHITSMHGWIQNTRKQRIGTFLDKMLILTVKHVIVISNTMKQLARDSGVKEERIEVLRNGLYLDDYPQDYTSDRILKEFSIPKDRVVIGIIGRLSEEKGHHDFVRTAKRVSDQVKNCHFMVVGDGPLLEQTRKTVEALGLSNQFTFTGHRTDMLDIYSAIDILAIASYTEGLPNVLLESFALHKPVVSTDVGGVSEVLTHGVNGYLTNPGEVEVFASHLAHLASDQKLRRSFGRQGRMTIENEFSFSRRVENLEKLYESIMQ